jgi:hypothetical protein
MSNEEFEILNPLVISSNTEKSCHHDYSLGGKLKHLTFIYKLMDCALFYSLTLDFDFVKGTVLVWTLETQ